MLDSSIITNGTLAAQAQQAQNMNMLGELGGAFGKLLLARQINDMNQMATPEEEKAFAQKHKLFAPQLMQQYNDNRASEVKSVRDGLKFYSDLGKTNAETGKLKSESGKIDAEKGKIGAETKGMDIDQNAKLNNMVWGSVLEGGKNAGLARLEMQKSRGEIDEATYNQQVGFINNLPGDLKLAREYAMAMYRGAQDPKYILPTADNVLNNETSTNNNVRDNQGRAQVANINGEWGVKQAATTGEYGLERETISQTHQDGRNQASLTWQRQQEEIKAKRGEYKSFGGKVYFVNSTGVYEAKDQNGNPILDNSSVNKPMPASALNLVSTSRDKIQGSQNTIDKIEQSIKDLDPKQGGKLSLGLLGNAGNVARNLTGNSNESSLAYERLNSNIKGMVNEVLQMAKGTQTEGDAQRAAKVILSTQLTDNRAVSNALAELKRVAQKTVALEQGKVEEVYSNYGKEAPIYPAASAPPSSIAAPKTPSGKPRPPLSAYGF